MLPLSKTDALKPTAQNLSNGYLGRGYLAERLVGA